MISTNFTTWFDWVPENHPEICPPPFRGGEGRNLTPFRASYIFILATPILGVFRGFSVPLLPILPEQSTRWTRKCTCSANRKIYFIGPSDHPNRFVEIPFLYTIRLVYHIFLLQSVDILSYKLLSHYRTLFR